MGETEGEDVANTPSGENASGHIRRGLKVGRSLASRRHLRHPRKKSLHHEPVASRRIWQGDLKFGHCEWCFLRNALKVFITGDADAAETPSRLASKTKKRGPRPSRPVCRVGEITILSITENLRESEYCVYRLPRAGPRSLAGMRAERESGSRRTVFTQCPPHSRQLRRMGHPRTRLRGTGGEIRTSANELVRRLDRGVRVGLVCQTTPQNVCNKGRCIVTRITPLEKSANNAPHKRRVKTGKRRKPRVDLLPSVRQLELIGQHESHRGRPRLVDSARDN